MSRRSRSRTASPSAGGSRTRPASRRRRAGFRATLRWLVALPTVPPLTTPTTPTTPTAQAMQAMRPRIGVLAVQGDVREHVATLASLGVAVSLVRRPVELKAVDALVIPGGESTVIDKLTRAFG